MTPKKKERLSRPRLARTTPIRNARTLLKGDFATPKTGESDGSLTDTLTQSVKLGYSVINDQIERGRKLAEQMGRRSNGGGLNGGIADIGQRILNFSNDLGALYIDLMEMMMRLPKDVDSLRRFDGNGSGHEGGSSHRASAHIAVDIQGRKHSRVTLDLRGESGAGKLVIPALYPLNSSGAPLTDIAVERTGDNGPTTLRIKIPDDQPAGTYTGVAVDGTTNEPRGTLSIQVTG
jgi:hypothetical protein